MNYQNYGQPQQQLGVQLPAQQVAQAQVQMPLPPAHMMGQQQPVQQQPNSMLPSSMPAAPPVPQNPSSLPLEATLPVPLEVYVDMRVNGAKVTLKAASMDDALALISAYSDGEATQQPVTPQPQPQAQQGVQGTSAPQEQAQTAPTAETVNQMVTALAKKVAKSFCDASRSNVPATANLTLWESNIADWLRNQFAANPEVYINMAESTPDNPKDNPQAVTELVNINVNYLLEIANG